MPLHFCDRCAAQIQHMCVAAEDISAPRERDQLRAILRFWASYVYDMTGTYPDTTLRPRDADQARPPVSEPPAA